MNEVFKVLPTMDIICFKDNKGYMEAFMTVSQFGAIVSNDVHTLTLRISQHTFWQGMNLFMSEGIPIGNFLEVLKQNSDVIPSNFIDNINSFIPRFDIINQLGSDYIHISKPDVLAQVLSCEALKPFIVGVIGNRVRLKNFTFRVLINILETEIGYPLTGCTSGMFIYCFRITTPGQDEDYVRLVKAFNIRDAFKELYYQDGAFLIGKNPFNEEHLKTILGIKDKPKEVDVTHYMDYMLKNLNKFDFKITASQSRNNTYANQQDSVDTTDTLYRFSTLKKAA